MHLRLLLSAALLCLALSLDSCTPEPPKGNFDLAIQSVSYKPNPVKVGAKVSFLFTIKNNGKDTLPAGSFDFNFYIDGRPVDIEGSLLSLPPGGTIRIGKTTGSQYHWEPRRQGEHDYRLVLDEKNRIRETDKTNNVLEGTIIVVP
jgi:subtilase family serine protease